MRLSETQALIIWFSYAVMFVIGLGFIIARAFA